MSGIYRYICEQNDLDFLNFRQSGSFDSACKNAINQLKKKEKVNFVFSYMFIDESQDFDESFFDLCNLVTEKNIYVAGDIFQSIFDENISSTIEPDFLFPRAVNCMGFSSLYSHAI